ncbi:MAG: hypothetical protein IPK19_42110 [Chloroflexi bacterium]|nr:hypothetical protein [Chloroflexota bacterium]
MLGRGIRSAGLMGGFRRMRDDNGGVHVNLGIPSRALRWWRWPSADRPGEGRENMVYYIM